MPFHKKERNLMQGTHTHRFVLLMCPFPYPSLVIYQCFVQTTVHYDKIKYFSFETYGLNMLNFETSWKYINHFPFISSLWNTVNCLCTAQWREKSASSRNRWTGNDKSNSSTLSALRWCTYGIWKWYVIRKQTKQAQYYVQWQALTLAVLNLWVILLQSQL